MAMHYDPEVRFNPLYPDSEKVNTEIQIQKRGQWSSRTEFLLAVAGQIIGLGNVWRFPYLCYKNGGGVFFIPYLLFLFSCGIPLFLLEISLGQYTSEGSITCWGKICPLFKGLGYGFVLVVFYSSIYYIVVLAWAFLYLFCSFSTELPWANCRNAWNTETCVEFDRMENNSSVQKNGTSPVIEFWERRILNITGSVYELGNMRWELALCLLLSWIICYFCVRKGVKSTGKVVYFTATFPYVMLVMLLVRGLTLPGAINGIIFYLYPDPSRLTDPQVWMDAGTQILYSYGLCMGCLVTLGSYNKYDNNCHKDCVYLCLLNSLTSFVAGFAIFSVLGFMAYEQGADISAVAKSGPGLAFIAYPRAVAMMPVPQLWAVCFFIMIILLGLDTEFVGLEAIVTAVSDMYPSIFHHGCRRQLLLLLICAGCFLIGLVLVTEGGLYIFQLFDYYSCSGMILLLFAILQSVCIGWVYGANRMYNNIEHMIGYQPLLLIKYCWKYITPLVCTEETRVPRVNPHGHREDMQTPHRKDSGHSNWDQTQDRLAVRQWCYPPSHLTALRKGYEKLYFKMVSIITILHTFIHSINSFPQSTFVFSLVKFTPLKFNNVTEYPWWGYALGWWFTLSSSLMVPLWMVYAVVTSSGSMRERLHVLCTPEDNIPVSSNRGYHLGSTNCNNNIAPNQGLNTTDSLL